MYAVIRAGFVKKNNFCLDNQALYGLTIHFFSLGPSTTLKKKLTKMSFSFERKK